MSPLEVVATVVGIVAGLSGMGAVFTRLVALPYLKQHLVDPLLSRLDSMASKDTELETATKVAAYMFEGHMTASEKDRGRLWEAVHDLRKDSHHHG